MAGQPSGLVDQPTSYPSVLVDHHVKITALGRRETLWNGSTQHGEVTLLPLATLMPSNMV